MFDELNEYSNNDHFFFRSSDDLGEVCNAPKNISGVYIIYALANGKVKLIYIGCSGKMQNDGTIKQRKGGLYDRIVNGKQFEEIRRKSWPRKMNEEQIEALDIYWYETFNTEINDIPSYVEALLIQKHFEMFGTLPRWNKEY